MDFRDAPTSSSVLSDSMTCHSPRTSIIKTGETCENEQASGQASSDKGSTTRTDSGYGDGVRDAMDKDDKEMIEGSTVNDILSRPSLSTTLCKAPSISSKENPLADAWASAWPACQRSRSSISSSTYLVKTSKPTGGRNSTGQRSSTMPRVSRPRMPSGKSSSSRTPQASLYGSHHLATSLRSTSTAYRSSFETDPYLVHERSRQLFGCPDPRMARPLVERFSSLPTNLHGSTAEVQSDPSGGSHSEKVEATTHHNPCTVIDWTSPSTRRKEYAKIDKSSRGIRGLWRRLAPRWCRRNSRLDFYNNGEDDDARSVRRYRVDLPGLQETDTCSSDSLGNDEKTRPALQRAKTSWRYLRSRRTSEKL